MKNERLASFCGRMQSETPFGQPRTEVIGGRTVTVTRFRKIFEIFRWEGVETQIKPNPQVPCLIDDLIRSVMESGRSCGVQGVCRKCRRRVKVKVE